MKRIFCPLLLMLFCTACMAPANVRNITAEDRNWLLNGEALGSSSLQIPEQENLLTLSEEMRVFTDRAVSGWKGRARVTALLKAILDESGLNLKYDANATFSAEETFQHRRANCLSFTNMFIAMARYAGMTAEYNEVDVPPIWDMKLDNTFVLNRHVNVLVTRLEKIRHVIDLNVEDYEIHYAQRTIPDQLALAQHYNNKAMQKLIGDDFNTALAYLVRAITLEPKVSYFWNNLGSLYRRAGNIKAAELAYILALGNDADDLVANSNLARLYNESGRGELAAYYEKKVYTYRMKNPYFLYRLAQQAFTDKDYELAEKYMSRAMRQYDKDHRFYFLLGAIYKQKGEAKLAMHNFNKALELTNDREQQSRYRSKMDRLIPANS